MQRKQTFWQKYKIKDKDFLLYKAGSLFCHKKPSALITLGLIYLILKVTLVKKGFDVFSGVEVNLFA